MPAPIVPILPPKPCRAEALRRIATLEWAAEQLTGYDLTHPEIAEALARLGHSRSLMKVLLAARMAHHELARCRLAAVLAEDAQAAEDAEPFASALFAEGL